ncbi:MAG TPA: imidazole glycerol phosphate synthase subunit HisH [Polyangiaceae bacterium]|nr:imidazole glycerol phosphate synthase subunit HisH [Polyangiaceae bacterium]
MTQTAVVVDIGIGNLRSVAKALEIAGEGRVTVVRSHDPDVVRRADRVVVPGQGGFAACAEGLAGGLDQALIEAVKSGVPYLGICLGLQVLFEGSEEAPGVPGFGWMRGQVRKLAGGPGIKIPHMGWNQLELADGGHAGLEAAGGQGAWVYFVHSYHAVPEEPGVLRASVSYGSNRVTAAVSRDNVLGTQFHPEKSQAAGLALLAAFLRR